MSNEPLFQVQVWFSGNVQGVNFRYTTLLISKDFRVSGRVKNLPDGRVWLLAEGEKPEVERFLNKILLERASYIHSTEMTNGYYSRVYDDFDIDY